MRKLLLLPLLVLGLAAPAPASGGEYTASIAPTGFPPLISIENGDTVTWKNNDAVDRQIVADDNSFKSPVLKPGESWSHTLVKGGTYTYHGAFKTNQRGAVEVASVRAVQMQQSAKTVQIFRAVRLQGSISKAGADGEVVSIEARPLGTSECRQGARTTTLNGVGGVRGEARRRGRAGEAGAHRGIPRRVAERAERRARRHRQAVRPAQAGRAEAVLGP